MKMNMLEKIMLNTQQLMATAQQTKPLQIIEQQALRQSPPRGFKAALDKRVSSGNCALITEIKHASPSAGIIRADFNPAAHAKAYASAGASCLSVLTEPDFFKGSIAHLQAAREAVNLPVLRKDFMVNEYHIIQSRAIGADCVLIIMAALDLHAAIRLEKTALALGMDVLIEVHDRRELELALSHMQSRLIGINNRNLATLQITLATSEYLRPLIPNDYTVVCESGIRNHGDIARMRSANMHVFLVGQSLMQQADIERATQALLQ
jgi:indole-3-glycerol phosphate synthase